MNRCEGKVNAVETPIGYVPKAEDIEVTGLSLAYETFEQLLTINKEEWLKEQKDHEEYFKMYGNRLPAEIAAQCQALKKRLS